MVTSDASALEALPPGSHVCCVVDDPAAYLDVARRVLADEVGAEQKAAVFGPADSPALAELGASAAIVADPWVEFLGRGPFRPQTMFQMFREHTVRAREEGYEGLRLVADMDWLVPAKPTLDDIVGFEIVLDRVVREVGATVVCAYRRSSFDAALIAGVLSVHAVPVADEQHLQFCLVAQDTDTWRLAGEVDLAVASAFAAAFNAAASDGDCVVDVSDLEFIDAAGMRMIAKGGRPGTTVTLLRVRPGFRAFWNAGGFGAVAPRVKLVA